MALSKMITCLWFITAFHLVMLFPSPAFSETARPAVWAGKFYPEDPVKLQKTIEAFCAKASKTQFNPPAGNHPLKALILPHAGYMYSGLTAAHGALALKGRKIKKIILIGPDHRVGFSQSAVTGFKTWNSPLGKTPIHPDARKLLKEKPARFRSVPRADIEEHSLEVVVPFLKTFVKSFELVPLVMGRDDPLAFSRDLLSVIPLEGDRESLLVVSSDLSHYLPYDQAVKQDRKTLDMILGLDHKGLISRDNAACGILPILSLVHMARQWGWKPFLIHYSNSHDAGGDKNKVVGYAAIAFYGGFSMNKHSDTTTDHFSESQGDVLVRVARKTISDKLGIKEKDVDVPREPLFSSHKGTFVTLKINHELRGCIGNLNSNENVVDGVRRNAINAAFSDYRFSPLTRQELSAVAIEVSVLTDPLPLEHKGGKDLLSRLRPGIDGVIIRKGGAGATFLPQVWEQLPDTQEFLEHLCRKAGLSKDEWMSPDLEVSTYQVQYFEEKK